MGKGGKIGSIDFLMRHQLGHCEHMAGARPWLGVMDYFTRNPIVMSSIVKCCPWHIVLEQLEVWLYRSSQPQ